MAVTLDTSADYLVWELRETVTYLPAPRNDLNRFPVTDAKRRALGFRDLMQGNGAYTSQDLVWWLPVATSQTLTGEYAPKLGDVIEDGNLSPWTVLEARLGKLGQSWRLVCRNLVLQASLRDKVTIYKPHVTTGPSGEPVYDWGNAVAVVSDLAARVQPLGGGVEVVNGVELATGEYRVVLGQEVDVRPFYRIQWVDKDGVPGPVVLQFVSSNNQGRIDVLPELVCKAVA